MRTHIYLQQDITSFRHLDPVRKCDEQINYARANAQRWAVIEITVGVENIEFESLSLKTLIFDRHLKFTLAPLRYLAERAAPGRGGGFCFPLRNSRTSCHRGGPGSNGKLSSAFEGN